VSLTVASPTVETDSSLIHWVHNDTKQFAAWRSDTNLPIPKTIHCIDDTVSADRSFSLASEGVALLWVGDFQNARQLLQAMARRVDRSHSQPKKQTRKLRKHLQRQTQTVQAEATLKDKFNQYRLAQSQRARTLNKLLVVLEADYAINLPRAPDWRQACIQAYGKPTVTMVKTLVSLRELLGVVGAYEWRKNGVFIPQLTAANSKIYPHYGVFAPVRQEYLTLLMQAHLPATVQLAFDIGTGTGVLAALLAQRGVCRVVATDINVKAIECARENVQHLGYADTIEVVNANMFPCINTYGTADLIVCNPPWLPARPNSDLEYAVYDPDSKMTRAFLNGVVKHLNPQGQAWLIMSNLAEQLGLRADNQLLSWIDEAGLMVCNKIDISPTHPKALNAQDSLYVARSKEVTSLWVLGLA
jgi:methylase of polypeptide subunit release factors